MADQTITNQRDGTVGVALVMVAGEVVVRDGRLLTADEDEVAREIAVMSARLRR